MIDAQAHDSGPPDARGGHALPSRFSDSAPTAPVRRRPGRVVSGILAVAGIAVTVGALQLTANLGYDDAADQYRSAAATATELRSTVDGQNAQLQEMTDAATIILQNDGLGLIDASSTEALTTAAAASAEVSGSLDETLTERIPEPAEKPAWFWELFRASATLGDDRIHVVSLTDRLRDGTDDIVAANGSLNDAGTAAFRTAAAQAGSLESAHVWARNDSVIGLRQAVDGASATAAIDDAAVSTFAELQTAAAQLVESERAELAEKAGPLYDTRLEVESFARSIAPGVLLEFDWAPTVNGYGANGSMGGYTTWWWDEPGRAVIQLSDSVAVQWPADRSKALVVHEVGHAISVKCADMYDASTQESIEAWATAWAISMGYTDDANGVWAYGYPPQSYIDAAAGCR